MNIWIILNIFNIFISSNISDRYIHADQHHEVVKPGGSAEHDWTLSLEHQLFTGSQSEPISTQPEPITVLNHSSTSVSVHTLQTAGFMLLWPCSLKDSDTLTARSHETHFVISINAQVCIKLINLGMNPTQQATLVT